jgi:hypothetical protein
VNLISLAIHNFKSNALSMPNNLSIFALNLESLEGMLVAWTTLQQCFYVKWERIPNFS